jgi:hypothetical protein
LIRVVPRPEPASFRHRVQEPGARFLALHPHPTSKQWAQHDYWNRVKHEFRETYGRICAYSCHWIPPDTGGNTVEHFIAKDIEPNRAYEWLNYRLVCSTLNGRKGIRQVLDPFAVQDDWFTLDFPSLLVKPSDELDAACANSITETINTLGLNDDGTCLQARLTFVMDYCNADVTLDFLRRRAPFIAREIERQGLRATLKDVMKPSANSAC